MAVVYFVGNDSLASRFTQKLDFDSVMNILEKYDRCAFDTETNVTESILNRKLKVVAIGVDYGQYIGVFEWEHLTFVQQSRIREYLKRTKCIIQAISFDYQVMKKHGVVMENVECTMLHEQVLTTGLNRDQGFHGLQALYQRRFDIDISKAEQLTFGEGPYNDDQIQYAAIDVLKLEEMWIQQRAEMKSDDSFIEHQGNKGMLKTIWWENEFAKVVGDMETTGIRLHKERWYEIEDTVRPIYDKELKALNDLVLQFHKSTLIYNGWYSEEDRFDGNIWSSTKKKLEFLQHEFPGIEKTSKVELKKYLKEYDPNFPPELEKALNGKKWDAHEYPTKLTDKYAIIKLLLRWKKGNNVEEILNKMILSNYRDLAIEKEWIIPAYKVTLNWNSPPQRLAIFQAINPNIESTGKEILEDYADNELVIHYLAWNDVAYQLKNFGKQFYDRFVQIDGKHRTRYRQILSTGRLSTSEPNILNIPRKNDAYRKAVIPDPGYKFINADYDGQELFITATLSGEPVWLEAIAKGYDLHSRNAHMIYGQRWEFAQESDCAYFHNQEYKKCKCKGHMEMRDNSKALSFGLIYGISAPRLAFNLKIEVSEAEMLIANFFRMLPNIKLMMDRFGGFALENGRIIDSVMGRSRLYDKWKLLDQKERGAVERASYNYPIQCAGSALLKIALVLLRRKLIHLGYTDEIQILMPYHDEISIQALPMYAERGRVLLEECMVKAASLAGFDGLKASAAIGDSWYDAH